MGPSQEQSTERDTPLSIPKLSLDGSNWVTFKTCFLYAMGGRDVEEHFDGSDNAPHQLTLSTPDESKWTMADRERNKDYLRSERKWQHNEKVTHTQLAQVVSDSLLIRIQHAKSITEIGAQ